MLKPSVQFLPVVVQAFPTRKEGGKGRLTAVPKMSAFTDLIFMLTGTQALPPPSDWLAPKGISSGKGSQVAENLCELPQLGQRRQ